MDKEFESLLVVARHALASCCQLTEKTVFFSGGFNGPYFDIETPIRNTSHWLISYSILYKETGRQPFHDIAEKLLDFLLKPGIYEKDGVLVHRQKAGKDWCNGVIGQAWVIEALLVAGKLLSRPDAVEKAYKLADAFDFSTKANAWSKKDPHNGKKGIDYTLNHQLWYAAALSLLNSELYDEQIIHFLDALEDGALRVRSDGRICHLYYTQTIKGLAFRARYALAERSSGNMLADKEIGYHLYNLHPLARLKHRFPEHPVFHSEKINLALDYAFSSQFHVNLSTNKYAYPYNSPAFEFPLIAKAFGRDLEEDFWNMQVDKTFNCDTNSFSRNCPDPLTLNARLYEFLLKIFYEKYL